MRLPAFLSGKYTYPVVAPIVVLLLLIPSLNVGLFDRLENMSLDARFRQRAPFDPTADPRIVFVKIDQPALDVLGRWPWERPVHAKFCQLLTEKDASVISFDILFTEPSATPGDDNKLALGFSLPDSVISGSEFRREIPKSKKEQAAAAAEVDLGKTQPLTNIEGDVSKLDGSDYPIYPVEPLRSTSFFGFVNEDPGFDGIRRELPLVVRVKNKIFPTLSLQSLCQLWKIDPDKVRVHLGKDIQLPAPDGLRTIPINERGAMLLNYRHKEIYTSISYIELFQPLYEREKDQSVALPSNFPTLTGKILFVGESDPALSDNAPSPLEKASPLPLVHIVAIDNILRNDYLRPVPSLPVLILWFLISISTLAYTRERSMLMSFVLPGAIVLTYLAAACTLFITSSLILPLVWPIVSFGLVLHGGQYLLRWLEEQRGKKEIRQIFSSYMAPNVLNRLLSHPTGVHLGGESLPVTIFFSDIRGFSGLSEKMNERELVSHLNEYFEKMVDCVNRYSGTLHKYIGDAIMAAWGDVLSEGTAVDAAKAIHACLDMREALKDLNAKWSAEGRLPIKIGMGLNHGVCLVGNIGAVQRREFTLMGDAVNLASRLEGVTKEYHTDLVISESVHDLVVGKFLMRTLGYIQVKGKTQPVKIFEVVDDLKKPHGPLDIEWVETFNQGMQDFIERRFADAVMTFRLCLEGRPDDHCSQVYLETCQELAAHPPGPDWSPVHVMKTK